MDSPIVIPEAHRQRPTSVRRRVSMDSNSPEFEFWMVRNPSFPQPDLLSADELFVDGVLLPLRLRSALSATHRGAGDPSPSLEPDPDDPEPAGPDPETVPEPGPGPGAKITSSSSSSSGVSSLSPSKRWRDIFKKSDKDKEKKSGKSEDKEKKKERKSGGGGSTSSAELNINIWPFSRSRSAGNACTRPKPVFGAPGSTRKVNSAPCSRSNSAGESKSRKWPGSPARPGVHLGRSSPVWKVRRNSGGKGMETMVRNSEKVGPKKELTEIHRIKATAAAFAAVSGGSGDVVGGTGKAKVLNLNVPMCMGYRNQLSCRSDENSAVGVGKNSRGSGGGGGGGGDGRGGGGRIGGGLGAGVGVGSGGNLFNFRSLFTKKVY